MTLKDAKLLFSGCVIPLNYFLFIPWTAIDKWAPASAEFKDCGWSCVITYMCPHAHKPNQPRRPRKGSEYVNPRPNFTQLR